MIHLTVVILLTVMFAACGVFYKRERPDLYIDRLAKSRTGVAKIATYPLAAAPALFLVVWAIALIGNYVALASKL